MLVSADELGMIKTWDVRTQKCVQSYLSYSRTIFKNIINLGNEAFMATEQRLTWFKYETNLTVNANGILIDGNFPNSVDYNIDTEEIMISTKTDIRFMDAKTGKTNRILSVGDSEITKSALNFDRKKVIVCKNNGEVSMQSTTNGEVSNNLIGHSSDVTNIYLDYAHKLIVTSGCDSRLIFQYDQKTDNLCKMQDKAHLKSEISFMTSNLSTVATVSGSLCFLWSHDTLKFIGVCTNHPYDITGISFVPGYPILVTCDTEPCIIMWSCLEKASGEYTQPTVYNQTLNYQMNRLIKIELPGLQVSAMVTEITQISVLELMETEFNPHDYTATRYVNRYLEELGPEDAKNESLETAPDENADHSKYLNDTAMMDDSEDEPEQQQPEPSRRRITWENSMLMHFCDESGYMHMLELNSLVNSVSMSKLRDPPVGTYLLPFIYKYRHKQSDQEPK